MKIYRLYRIKNIDDHFALDRGRNRRTDIDTCLQIVRKHLAHRRKAIVTMPVYLTVNHAKSPSMDSNELQS